MSKTMGRANGDGDMFLCPLSPVQLNLLCSRLVVKNGLSQAVFLARGCPPFAGCSVLSGVSNTRSALLCPTKLGPWSHDSGTPPPLR